MVGQSNHAVIALYFDEILIFTVKKHFYFLGFVPEEDCSVRFVVCTVLITADLIYDA